MLGSSPHPTNLPKAPSFEDIWNLGVWHLKTLQGEKHSIPLATYGKLCRVNRRAEEGTRGSGLFMQIFLQYYQTTSRHDAYKRTVLPDLILYMERLVQKFFASFIPYRIVQQ